MIESGNYQVDREWEYILMNNAVVRAANMAGAEPRQIVIILAKQNQLLMECLMELELIAPRMHIFPDGTT